MILYEFFINQTVHSLLHKIKNFLKYFLKFKKGLFFLFDNNVRDPV